MHIPSFDFLRQAFVDAFYESAAEETPAAKKDRASRDKALHSAEHLGFLSPGLEKTKTAAALIMEFADHTKHLTAEDRKDAAEKFLNPLTDAGFKPYDNANFFTEVAPSYIVGDENIAHYRQVGLAMGILKNGEKLDGMIAYELRKISESANPPAPKPHFPS